MLLAKDQKRPAMDSQGTDGLKTLQPLKIGMLGTGFQTKDRAVTLTTTIPEKMITNRRKAREETIKAQE